MGHKVIRKFLKHYKIAQELLHGQKLYNSRKCLKKILIWLIFSRFEEDPVRIEANFMFLRGACLQLDISQFLTYANN